MINIIDEPLSTPVDAIASIDPKGPPVPVTDCFTWCLQLDDADSVVTAGTFATVAVSFPYSTVVVSPGTPFKIWGRDFTVNNSVSFTATSFKTVTLGRTTAANFLNMIRANLFFARDSTAQIVDTGSAYVVTITWNDCREQANFTGAGMVFTGIEATGATVTYSNGVSPVYVDGVRVVTQLIYNSDLNTPVSVSEFEGHEVDRLCDSVAPVCINYRSDIEGQLHTILPALNKTSFVTMEDNAQSMMKVFQLNYGFMYRENCVSKSGTFMRSAYVVGINAAFPQNDPYGMRKYWFEHPDGFPPGQSYQKFLTTQPSAIRLCDSSFHWLWLTNNFSQTYGADYKLVARFTVYKDDVYLDFYDKVIFDSATDPGEWFYPICFNASPSHVSYLRLLDGVVNPDSFDYYTVEIQLTDLDDIVLDTVTESLKVVKIGCDCSKMTDVYFLTPAGGYGTLPVETLSESIVREGTEVNLYVPCSWDFEQKNKEGGRTLVNIRNYERRSIKITALSKVESSRQWFKDFINSPVKFIKETNRNYNFARKIIIDPGTVEIYAAGDFLEMTANIYLSDINVQNPANQ